MKYEEITLIGCGINPLIGIGPLWYENGTL